MAAVMVQSVWLVVVVVGVVVVLLRKDGVGVESE
jgi:hypothetical protein